MNVRNLKLLTAKKDQMLSSQSPQKSITLGSYYSHRIDKQTHRWGGRQAGRQTEGQTDRQMDGWTDKQTDNRTFLETGFLCAALTLKELTL